MQITADEVPNNEVGVRVPIFKRLALHPVVVFAGTWSFVLLLHELSLSHVLLYKGAQIYVPVLVIVLSFAAGYFFHPRTGPSPSRVTLKLSQADVDSLERKVNQTLKWWAILTVGEIVYSGGIPSYWLLIGNGKTYLDYGAPSIHGLLNGTILTCSLASVFLAKYSRKRRYKLIPFLLPVWAILVVARQLVVTNLIEIAFLQLLLHPPLKLRNLGLGLLVALTFAMGFGVLGDFRSGGADFMREWAEPTDNYPTFLPSGFLWVYIYVTTPLNNLVNLIVTRVPDWNLNLQNTLSSLFPTVIRRMLYREDEFEYELVKDAFTVCTAFYTSYKDVGYAGIAGVGAIAGYFSARFWVTTSLGSVFAYAILSQCNVLSIFDNLFFYLPILIQFVVIWYFLKDLRITREA